MNTFKYYHAKSKQFANHDYTDKASYLKWVAEWKATYKELTHDIRSLREELSKPHIINKYGDNSLWSESSGAQYKKTQFRAIAPHFLSTRHDGKRKSWELKQLNTQKA